MKPTPVAVILLTIVLSLTASAGGWDAGPFDNDDALDWVWELEESSDLSVVESALKAAAESRSYMEAPTGSMAIAAAEVVAALNGQPHAQLPEEVVSWVESKSLAGNDKLVNLALEAIERVKDPNTSELAQLWSDSEAFRTAWLSGLSDLEQRLKKGQ